MPPLSATPLALQKAIVNDNIDEGLDRKNLTLLKKRFALLNSDRLERINSALPQRQRIFLQLLPLLFHVNHPMLPGYVGANTPAGVSGYSPDDDDIRAARRLARSFKCGSELNRKRQIHALFVMGSAGTIGHSEKSDLDIWLCHKPKLSAKALQQLNAKCHKISAWADKLGLEAHCFPMDAEAFKNGQQAGLDSEASGSAQHFLLLDEFYRTAVQIAGRIPLWWLIPSHSESNYSHYSETLLNKRFVRPAEVLDFGGVAEIPKGEFAGAGIWQLYKGIDSPYKSLLKLLLLETYTNGNSPALSLEFKAEVYRGNSGVDQLDAYALIYHRIESYLLSIADPQRLELARRCFYFKVGKALSRAPQGREKSWQRNLLETLVQDWGWDLKQLRYLDSRPSWKTLQVCRERRELVHELSTSYRLLIEFVRQHGASSSIDAREMKVLGRKLHAAFERKAGKIDWINPNISADISEDHLFFQQIDGVWHAFAGRPQNSPGSDSNSLKRGSHLLPLLLWCHSNGLLIATSKLDIQAQPQHYQQDRGQLAQTRKALQQWLPIPLTAPSHEAYLQPSQCQQLLLLINSDCDPSPELGQQGLVRTSEHDDPLNFGRDKRNLIASIDTISRSNWNEVNSQHFTEPSQALIEALLQLLRLNPGGFPELSVQCFTPSYGSAISQRLSTLLADINQALYPHGSSSNRRYIFTLGGQHCLLQLKRGQANAKVCANRLDLLTTLSWPQRSYSDIAIDARSFNGDPLHAITQNHSNATIQVYYYLPASDLADLYILDERGSLFYLQLPFHDPQTLLSSLHRFLRRVLERHQFTDQHHDPDFGVKPIDFFEIDRKQQVQQKTVNTSLNPLQQFDIEVIVEGDVSGRQHYSIFCQQMEFSHLLHGDQLFVEVARYILSKRPSGKRYPCFITDLDISQCSAQIAGDHSLQVINYLNLKAELEQKLNSALLSL